MKAFVTGATGQDGSYCCDLLLEKGYTVHALVRRSSVDNLQRIRHCLDRLTLWQGDLCDPQSVDWALRQADPVEVYHFADQDHVGFSHETPGYSLDVTAGAVARLLESVRRWNRQCKVFLPCSATVFGAQPPPQNESTPFAPASPYACAKAAAFYLGQHYRREHGLFVTQAIFFNHDSERRGPGYLLQRIARGEELWGDLEAVVGVGYAPEYVEAAWRMLQLDRPDDFVIGTGRGYRIRDLMEGVQGRWWCIANAPGLIADTSKAQRVLGWNPKYDALSTLELIRREHS